MHFYYFYVFGQLMILYHINLYKIIHSSIVTLLLALLDMPSLEANARYSTIHIHDTRTLGVVGVSS